MKTQHELLNKLRELKEDERMSYPHANVQINCVLAMIQCEVGGRINTLEWVLGIPLSTFPLPKPKRRTAGGNKS